MNVNGRFNNNSNKVRDFTIFFQAKDIYPFNYGEIKPQKLRPLDCIPG